MAVFACLLVCYKTLAVVFAQRGGTDEAPAFSVSPSSYEHFIHPSSRLGHVRLRETECGWVALRSSKVPGASA